MPYQQFDRAKVLMRPLAERDNKKDIQQHHIAPDAHPQPLPPDAKHTIAELAGRIRTARLARRPVMFTFGAHAIKNGLGPVFQHLVEGGWVTHLATNGAGIIHDWEFAYQGQSCEDVAKMVDAGKFGNWQETGFLINLALNVGSYEGLGYGESIGALIENEGLTIPSTGQLEREVTVGLSRDPEQAAAAADLLGIVRHFDIDEGWLAVPHPFKQYSVQAAAYRLGVPLTGHPMFGHDIIYTHPMNHGASVGRTAQSDFLTFAQSVSQLEGGVYVSIGSAVMSPMVFEKSLSMAQNIAIQQGHHIDHHYLFICDLAESNWDWSHGEPPEENPAYYLRYNKSFSRMGGTMRYLQADNRDFLLTLVHMLDAETNE